jgi:cysteinyl-tRNA synthetase
MNYTDVDDKVILRAQDLGVDPISLAERYIEEYDRLITELNILQPEVKPRVSEEIKAIVGMVQGLLEKGYAYEMEGDVYFRVERDEDYGKLSRRQLADMRAGFRMEVDQRKEDPADFALWKSAKPGEPAWDSPWGKGRPGWHIECSAMALRHLGKQIDIHGGGNDLVFPHHENEIAQTESLIGKPFARYWVHNGMLQIRGEAMSKSVGNMVTVEEFLRDHEPEVLRLMILNGHYRAPLTFSEQTVEQAEKSLERLRAALRGPEVGAQEDEEAAHSMDTRIAEVREAFEGAMEDDFNTPGALAQLFDLVRSINQARDGGMGPRALGRAQKTLLELSGVLGLRLEVEVDFPTDVEPFIELLIEVREELRNEGAYGLADLIRERLWNLGIALEDEKSGTIWRPT